MIRIKVLALVAHELWCTFLSGQQLKVSFSEDEMKRLSLKQITILLLNYSLDRSIQLFIVLNYKVSDLRSPVNFNNSYKQEGQF